MTDQRQEGTGSNGRAVKTEKVFIQVLFYDKENVRKVLFYAKENVKTEKVFSTSNLVSSFILAHPRLESLLDLKFKVYISF